MKDESDKKGTRDEGHSSQEHHHPAAQPAVNPILTETGSSVIIDIGQLGDPAKRTDGPQPMAPPMVSQMDMTKITFSDLEAFVPTKEPQPVVERPVAPVYEPPAPDDLVEVRPPSLFRFFLVVLILILGGATGFAGWRLDWDWTLLQNDPVRAVNVIMGVQPKPAPPVVAPPPPPPVEQMQGELRIKALTIQPKKGKKHRATVVVRGEVHNETNRRQKAITLKVSLTTLTGTPIDAKKHDCCSVLSPAEGAQDAVQSKAQNTVIQPGEKASFEVLFVGRTEDVSTMKPVAEVTFFESERAP